MSLSMVVGLLASGVFLVRLLPQPARLARTGVVSGVSPMAALNAVASAAAWTIYGFDAGLRVVWVVSLLALVPGVWTAWLLRRSVGRADLVGAGAWMTLIAAALAAGTLGPVLALSVATTMGPQVLAALRSDDLSGIATATMWVALLDAVLWGAYGVVIGDRSLASYALILGASALTILVRVGTTRSRRRAVAPAPAPVRA